MKILDISREFIFADKTIENISRELIAADSFILLCNITGIRLIFLKKAINLHISHLQEKFKDLAGIYFADQLNMDFSRNKVSQNSRNMRKLIPAKINSLKVYKNFWLSKID